MGCGCKQKPRQEPQVITSVLPTPQVIEIKEETKHVEEHEEEN
jgi:hypothetical protein